MTGAKATGIGAQIVGLYCLLHAALAWRGYLGSANIFDLQTTADKAKWSTTNATEYYLKYHYV